MTGSVIVQHSYSPSGHVFNLSSGRPPCQRQQPLRLANASKVSSWRSSKQNTEDKRIVALYFSGREHDQILQQQWCERGQQWEALQQIPGIDMLALLRLIPEDIETGGVYDDIISPNEIPSESFLKLFIS